MSGLHVILQDLKFTMISEDPYSEKLDPPVQSSAINSNWIFCI